MPATYQATRHGYREFTVDNPPTDLVGRHTHEWHRYIITAPTFLDAGKLAAKLGWWLHCWDWEHSNTYTITDKDPPTPWASWHAYATTPRGRNLHRAGSTR